MLPELLKVFQDPEPEFVHLLCSAQEQRYQALSLARGLRLGGAEVPADAGDAQVGGEGPDERREAADQPGQEGSRPHRRTGLQGLNDPFDM